MYEFALASHVNLAEAESTLQLAIIAAEGIFGESRMRMEFSYSVDSRRSVITIDGRTAPGEAVIRVYAAYLAKEFGRDTFVVRRAGEAQQARSEAGTAA